jgi:O-antigen ligase
MLYFIVPIFVLFVSLNIYLAPQYAQRIPKVDQIYEALLGKTKSNERVNTGSNSSTSRVFIWKASIELFSENLLKGLGTGDGKDELVDKYQKLGMINEYKHKLNSHNQYLTTSLSLGLGGLIILLFTFFYPLVKSIRNKDVLLSGFVFLLLINFMFESVIETSAGIIFFTFFYTLLYSNFEKINYRKQ